MSIGSVALKSGIGIGVATAIGSFVAHEQLEQDGQWTDANSNFSTAMQLGALSGSVAALGAGSIMRSNALIGVGGGILFGAQIGNLAGMLGAMAIK
jgi:uncharacterized membrane protein YdjX (TVP38/TMEM64 family)